MAPAPVPTDLRSLEGMLDQVLGDDGMFDGASLSPLDRVEYKLGLLLDRNLPDKIEAFHHLSSNTKSALIKEKSIIFFAKANWTGLLGGASVTVVPPEAPAADSKKRAFASSHTVSSEASKKPRSSMESTGGHSRRSGRAGGKAQKVEDDEEIMMSDTSELSMDESEAGKKKAAAAAKAAAAKDKPLPVVHIEAEFTPDQLAQSDGKLKGELYIVEKCPALVYQSWRDADHDVYLYGLTRLAPNKRQCLAGGTQAYFMGFGSYKEFPPGEFKGSKLPGDARTCDRPLEEIVSFLRKAARSKGGKGESSRKKAFKDTMKFFHEQIHKVPMPDDEPVVPKRPPKKKATSEPKGKHRARTPKKMWPFPYGPAGAPGAPVAPGTAAVAGAAGAVAAVPVAAAAPLAPGQVEGQAGKSAKDLEEEERRKREQKEREEEAAEVRKLMEADKSIPGLFNMLRLRMGDLEDRNFNDQVVWSFRSAMSNVDHLSEKLFSAEVDDPEGEEWRKMIQSCLEKLQRQMDDRVPHLAPEPGSIIKSVAVCLWELSQAIGAYDLSNPDYDMLDKVENYEPPKLPPKKKPAPPPPAPPVETTTSEAVSPLEDPSVVKEGPVEKVEAEGAVEAVKGDEEAALGGGEEDHEGKKEGAEAVGNEKEEHEQEQEGSPVASAEEPSPSPSPPHSHAMDTDNEPPAAPQEPGASEGEVVETSGVAMEEEGAPHGEEEASVSGKSKEAEEEEEDGRTSDPSVSKEVASPQDETGAPNKTREEAMSE